MNIKIEKETGIDGRSIYWLIVDGEYVDKSKSEQEAMTALETLKKNAALGLPKKEIIHEEEIQ